MQSFDWPKCHCALWRYVYNVFPPVVGPSVISNAPTEINVDTCIHIFSLLRLATYPYTLVPWPGPFPSCSHSCSATAARMRDTRLPLEVAALASPSPCQAKWDVAWRSARLGARACRDTLGLLWRWWRHSCTGGTRTNLRIPNTLLNGLYLSSK